MRHPCDTCGRCSFESYITREIDCKDTVQLPDSATTSTTSKMHLSGFVVVILMLGGAWASPVVLSPKDISDFASVIPLERVWDVVSDYLAYDNDVKNLVAFMGSDEFKNMIIKIDNIPDFIEFLNSLEASGFPAIKYWNIIHTFLGLPGLDTPTPQLTGGVAGLVGDVRALLMEREIKFLYEAKLKSSPKLRALVDHFNGQKFKAVLGKVAVLPEVETILEKIGLSDTE